MSSHRIAENLLADVNVLACPRCGEPAAVEWSTSMESTDGPVEHVKVRCLDRHWFLLPVERLPVERLPVAWLAGVRWWSSH